MSTTTRLNRLFAAAPRVAFSHASRLAFFSDLHRGDNSWADEFARNQILMLHALNHYLETDFTYIEVGDGDELAKNSSFADIYKAHSDIFDLMKCFYEEQRLYMLYGNHDIERRDPLVVQQTLHGCKEDDVDCFSPLFEGIEVHEGLVFRDVETGHELFVFHGHQGGFLSNPLIWISRQFMRRFWRPLQLFGMQDPTSVSWSAARRNAVEKSILRWVAATHQPVLCGHTHRARLAHTGQLAYFNTDSCVHPRWISGLEIENGAITLVRWLIRPDQKGLLRVWREIMDGPQELDSFYSGSSGTTISMIR